MFRTRSRNGRLAAPVVTREPLTRPRTAALPLASGWPSTSCPRTAAHGLDALPRQRRGKVDQARPAPGERRTRDGRGRVRRTGTEVTFTQQGMWITEHDARAPAPPTTCRSSSTSTASWTRGAAGGLRGGGGPAPDAGQRGDGAWTTGCGWSRRPVPVRHVPAQAVHARPSQDPTRVRGPSAAMLCPALRRRRSGTCTRLVREEILRGFDLEKGPLARFTLVRGRPGTAPAPLRRASPGLRRPVQGHPGTRPRRPLQR